MVEPIPGPPALPFLGNSRDIILDNMTVSLMALAEIYGPIYKLNLRGQDRIFITSHELVNEVCDQKRFTKQVVGSVYQLRAFIHDALVTAHGHERNWGLAHRILTPAFGPLAIRNMFEEMRDVSSQMILRWARFGPNNPIHVTADFTRLTLDTLGICAMDTRLNSFYTDEMHPVVAAFMALLAEAGYRANMPAFASYFRHQANQEFDKNSAILHKFSQDVINRRRAIPSPKKDLVGAMINGRDPLTGEGLDDATIANNMINFLIAGHETTSGLLSFLFMYLMQYPEAYSKLQNEVDTVLGSEPISVDDLAKLPYMTACIREALRLQPTAPVFALMPIDNGSGNPVIIGGRYEIKKGQTIVTVLPGLHRDKAVFGEDAEEFKPERMLDEPFKKLPKNSWKPWGHGSRACIGSGFAMQETLLATAMLFQKFDFKLVDPEYKCQIQQALTIKPKGLYMYATLRPRIDILSLQRDMFSGADVDAMTSLTGTEPDLSGQSSKVELPMSIFYGSNTGTCRALADSLAVSAQQHGFTSTVLSLDDGVGSIPRNSPTIFITASYEGQPPDNAAKFVEWLTDLKSENALEGVRYAVFGCGHRDWPATFQRVPILLDSRLEECGGIRLAARGFADAAEEDMFNKFDSWQADNLWPGVEEEFEEAKGVSSSKPLFDVEISSQLQVLKPRQKTSQVRVIETMVLTTGDRPKIHMKVQLPGGASYRVGDYLEVVPFNSKAQVDRVLTRFNLSGDAVLTIRSRGSTALPCGVPLSAYQILGSYIELNQPATIKQINSLVNECTDEKACKELNLMSQSVSECSNTTARRPSLLDILEALPNLSIPLVKFLSMLPPLRARQYSISSSPLEDPTTCTITWSLVTHSVAFNGKSVRGLASHYLAASMSNDKIQAVVRSNHQMFRPPSDPATTPVIMICAGSGLAPFRGFVQERAQLSRKGVVLAPALLFVGCTGPENALYAAELAAWEACGVVEVRYAYSRHIEKSKGCQYVQDRVWMDREEVIRLFEDGGKIYVCGSNAVSDGVKITAKRIFKEVASRRCGVKTDEEADQWFVEVRKERYAVEVF